MTSNKISRCKSFILSNFIVFSFTFAFAFDVYCKILVSFRQVHNLEISDLAMAKVENIIIAVSYLLQLHFRGLSFGQEKEIGRRKCKESLIHKVGFAVEFITKKQLSISSVETKVHGEKPMCDVAFKKQLKQNLKLSS